MNAATTEAKSTQRSLADVIQDFALREGMNNPDLDVPLRALKMTEAGAVAVPDGRSFVLNDWSRRQLASLVGARWDRWFEDASASQVADEINRRFSRSTRTVRLRTATQDDEDGGVLRAFVTPTYAPIPDTVIASDLATALHATPAELRVLRCSVTEMSTSLVVAVGQPFRRGDGSRVGDVHGGLALRNSDTGFASLTITTHLVRLVCSNGMTLAEPNNLVLKRAHRGLDRERIMATLQERLGDLPGRLRRGVDRLELAIGLPVADVDAEIRRLLETAHQPLRLAPTVFAAYAREPHASVFGVVQALTLGAQALSPEVRFDLERAAGAYLARSTASA